MKIFGACILLYGSTVFALPTPILDRPDPHLDYFPVADLVTYVNQGTWRNIECHNGACSAERVVPDAYTDCMATYLSHRHNPTYNEALHCLEKR